MQINRRHPVFDVLAFALDVLIWITSIAGPIVLLARRHVLLSVAAAAIAIGLFTASFRWRSGYALLPGCLGLALVIWNTATVCFGFAFLSKNAGFGILPQVAAALAGIPSVMILVKIVETVLSAVLGPTTSPLDDRSATPDNDG